MNFTHRFVFALFLFGAAPLFAQNKDTGAVSGSVFGQTTGRPVEYVTFALKKKSGGKPVRTAVSDSRGGFVLEKIPFGDYAVMYGLVGGDSHETPAFTLDAQHPSHDLGRLALGETAVKMDAVQVSARQDTLYNSIDRKVYNVGQDIQSTTGSASGLLQNIPSVQVDIEGNVSLRGDANVLILIDGKTSTLMSAANRADVLDQMPADAIEKIEVITNPSAKYKPDGTAGIINISLKRKHDSGSSGVVRVNVGNDGRYNLGLTANYHPAKYNLFGTFSVRQDDRLRFSEDTRSHLDAATNTFLSTEQRTVEHMRPLSRLAQTGADYAVDDATKIGATVDYNLRTFFRDSTISNLSRDANGAVTGDYDRLRTDPEWQKTLAFKTTYQHSFAKEGQELNVELKRDRHWEQEDNHYSDIYRTPVTPTTLDYTLIKPTETGTELTVDYSHPFGGDAKLDAGYSREDNKNDMDFRGGFFDPASAAWVVDTTRTNRFIYNDTIDALYATYGRPVGKFGFLAGLRMEQTDVHTNQVTARLTDSNAYFRVYPTLHLSYNLTETGQLQLNYSHRIHRPESDDLNPFPEYQDPYNLRAGNPHLRPEDTHSIETGYQYRKDETTYLATLYYRDTYHGFTTVTRYIDSTTLLTTHENLASNRASGLELAATTNLGPASVNFSSNVYRNTIDAANLGYSAGKSATAWDAKLNMNLHASKTTLIQLNTNYTSTRLTPQGERRPTYIANLGLRHEFADKKTALVLTVSDLFNSLKERTVIDTPVLHEDVTRRRSSRIIYAGLIYNFGKAVKKKKDDTLQFDSSL